MRPSLIPIALCSAALLISAFSNVMADDLSTKGREVFEQKQRTTATVLLVIKSKMSVGGQGGRSSESKQEATGTVIDANGLTVISLSVTDPGGFLAGMGMDDGEGGGKFKVESELSDVKILTEDGNEIPAEIILRDKDLDLAFVRPKQKPAAPFPFVDLSDAAEVQILDQVITLNRLGKAAGRSYAASVERVSAVVQKPRRFYVVGGDATSTGLGSPAFTLDKKVVGVFVMRMSKSTEGGGLFGMNLQPGDLRTIILPASTIAKAAKQVPPPKE